MQDLQIIVFLSVLILIGWGIYELVQAITR
jgi:hypothetical protein